MPLWIMLTAKGLNTDFVKKWIPTNVPIVWLFSASNVFFYTVSAFKFMPSVAKMLLKIVFGFQAATAKNMKNPTPLKDSVFKWLRPLLLLGIGLFTMSFVPSILDPLT